MKRKTIVLRTSFLFFSTILLIAACAPKTVEPVVTTVENKVYDAAEVAQGKELYAAHCVKCHQSFDPSAFNEAKWRHEVADMAKKAKIDAQKENLILTYVLAGAKK